MSMRKPFSRRSFLETGSIVLASVGLGTADAQNTPLRSAIHSLENEKETGPKNTVLDEQNASSNWSPVTDAGGQPPFKYPFSFSHKRIEDGGWTRQITVRDLPMSKKMAGVQMRLIRGGIRELHWHVGSEWAFMISGKARITAVDAEGHGFVEDVSAGDLWVFPGGIPHSIQGIGEEGAFFLLVFDDGNFNEFETFLLTDWLHHTEPEVLAKNFQVPASVFAKVPAKELFHLRASSAALACRRKARSRSRHRQPQKLVRLFHRQFALHQNDQGRNRQNHRRQSISRNHHPPPPSSPSSPAACVSCTGTRTRMSGNTTSQAKEECVCLRPADAPAPWTSGAGDVGYINKSEPHFIENTGDEDLIFLEVFPTPHYQDISLASWLAHTPSRLVDQHLATGEDFLHQIQKTEVAIKP